MLSTSVLTRGAVSNPTSTSRNVDDEEDEQPMSLMPSATSPDAILSELHYSSSSEASTSATTSSGTTVRHIERELEQVLIRKRVHTQFPCLKTNLFT